MGAQPPRPQRGMGQSLISKTYFKAKRVLAKIAKQAKTLGEALCRHRSRTKSAAHDLVDKPVRTQLHAHSIPYSGGVGAAPPPQKHIVRQQLVPCSREASGGVSRSPLPGSELKTKPGGRRTPPQLPKLTTPLDRLLSESAFTSGRDESNAHKASPPSDFFPQMR